MQKLILVSLITFNLSVAQDEPKKLHAKDMMDKVNRSDIQADESIEIENIVPKLDMPKLPMKSPITQEPAKTQNVEQQAVSKPQHIEKKVEPAKIVIAKKAIGRSQLRKNDKVVIFDSETYIYRTTKDSIVQYSFNSKLPLNSKGLKAVNNDYIITDPGLLRKDLKAMEKLAEAQEKQDAKVVSKEKAPKKQEAVIATVESIDLSQLTAARLAVEEKYNHGKKIKKSLKLKNLQTNDVVYLIGNVQLVYRKKKSTSGVSKYWLTEKIDRNSPSLEKTGKNKYKVIRKYIIK